MKDAKYAIKFFGLVSKSISLLHPVYIGTTFPGDEESVFIFV